MSIARGTRFIGSIAIVVFAQSLCSEPAYAFVVPTKIVNPAPGVDEIFGNSVDVDGDLMAVGVAFDTQNGNARAGSVVVYRRVAGDWTQEATLVPQDSAANDWFGKVSVSGNRILIGASRKDGGLGAAYVYRHDGAGVWVQEQRLQPGDLAGGCGDPVGCHLYGVSVALDGGRAVIGANTQSQRRGAAYVYVLNGNTWTLDQKLTASDAQPQMQFGNSVAISGDTVLVTAHLDQSSRGAAYVYVRGPQGWTQQGKLQAADGQAGDIFGFHGAIQGDVIVVGSRLDDVNGLVNTGSAYVFRRSAGAWTQEAQLTASDSAPGIPYTSACNTAPLQSYDQFGYAVAIADQIIAVGAMHGCDSIPSIRDTGKVYLYSRLGGQWTEVLHLVTTDASAGDGLGNDLALDADTLVIGAEFEGSPPSEVADRGSIYVIARTALEDLFANGYEALTRAGDKARGDRL